MKERWQEELELLKKAYPDLETSETDGHWCRLPSYRVPGEAFQPEMVEVAFRIPGQAGEQPYGFWVRPGVEAEGGATISNYSFPATTPWGSDWGQFSWSPVSWLPKADVRAGSNMVNFVRSFADRLGEGP